ncbi:MAG: hypothetical protein J5905_08320 [Prevotella sp.]|nr:hypothetical protein [Prevotella sp.]
MIKKRLKISKKIYVSPLVEFEEIEQDELDMLMISNNEVGGNSPGTETPTPGYDPQNPFGASLDLGFEEEVYETSNDFIINDEF